MVSWKSHVGQRLVDSFPQDLSRRPQVHVQQLGYHFLGLFLGGLLALLGLDGLEHRSDFRDLFPGHLGQDVPVEMEDATLPVSIRQALVYRLHQPQALVANYKPNPRKAPRDQVPEKFHPTLLVLLHALANFHNFPVSVGVHADRHQQNDLAHLATPGPFQPNAVQVQVGVGLLDRLVSPGLNLRVHLLVQLADRRGGDVGAPQGFRDVLHPTDADTGQVHLDQGLLNTGFPALVPFNDLGLKRQRPQAGYLQGDLASLGLQLPAITARSSVHASRAPLVPLDTVKLVGLLVQDLLHRGLHQPVQVVPDLALINSDHVPNIARLAALAYACHRGLRLVLGNGLVATTTPNLTEVTLQMCE